MANIFETLLPTHAYDQVAIYNQNFDQVFPRARPVKAIIKEEAKVMEHPLESGATIVDHRIVLPVECEITMILQAEDYQDTYRQIKQAYLNAELLIVQTKSSVYYNQLIASMPHEENPDLYDAITLELGLKEAQFATTRFEYVPSNPKQSSTVNRGTQQPQTITREPLRSDASRYIGRL